MSRAAREPLHGQSGAGMSRRSSMFHEETTKTFTGSSTLTPNRTWNAALLYAPTSYVTFVHAVSQMPVVPFSQTVTQVEPS